MENPQAQHFENVHDIYASHYYDAESTRYRKKFIYDLMFDGLEVNGKDVADLCCGDGHYTLKIKEYFPTASVRGFDISPTAIETYNRITGSVGQVLDLIKPIDASMHQQFDVVSCMGGIHHCVLDLPQLLKNVVNMLRPGGVFVCMEPYASPLLDPIRKLWYKVDPYFDAPSERALLPEELTNSHLTLEKVRYGGGPAFYLVNNSMMFRIPKPIKRAISPPLLAIEPFFEAVLPNALKGFFVAHYRKHDDATAANRTN
jgi:ubiquinone/menaquinone biosynthesis C-methylase UbiE